MPSIQRVEGNHDYQLAIRKIRTYDTLRDQVKQGTERREAISQENVRKVNDESNKQMETTRSIAAKEQSAFDLHIAYQNQQHKAERDQKNDALVRDHSIDTYA